MIPSILPTYNRAPLAFVKGEGSWLVAEDGTRYLDLGAGIAVNALGHAHPDLVAALTEQAGRVWHVSNVYQIPEQQRLADLLVEKTFADTVFFTNSGTETAELAIKMARKFHHDAGQPERVEIIAFEGAFHGRSTGAIAAAGSEKMVKGFGPLMPGFVQLKWPASDADHAAIRAAITDRTCAVIIEPIQGEGGIRSATDAFMQGLRALADEHDLMLALDEVQCGYGRSGTFYAYEQYGIEPDIVASAKGIGGGFPMGACLATGEAAAGMTAGVHGTTFGGNPLAMAAGEAVLDAIAAEDILANVRDKGAKIAGRLEQFIGNYPELFEEVRGRGLLLGIKLRVEPRGFVAHLRDSHGLLTVAGGDNTVRVVPPLVIDDSHIDEFMDKLSAAAASYPVEPTEK